MKSVLKFIAAICVIVVVAVIVFFTSSPQKQVDTDSTTVEVETTTEKPTAARQGPLTLDEAIKNYKTDETEIGVDVSRWQGDIDFQELKDAGVTFVYMRLGVQDGFNGKRYGDKKVYEYYAAAKAAGLKIGVYYHSCALTVEDAEEDATFVISKMKAYGIKNLDFPIIFDWESWDDIKDTETTTEELKTTLNDCYKAFKEGLAESSLEAGLYASSYYLDEGFWSDVDNLWLAEYNEFAMYEGDYFMWQCCNEGTVPGIPEVCDIDVLYVNKQ